MEKRLVLFLVLSVVILTGHVMVRSVFFPPPLEVVEPGDAEQPKKKSAEEEQRPDVAPAEKALVEPEQRTKAADGPPAERPGGESEDTTESSPATPTVPQQWATLGSFDPQQGSRLMVTTSNWGATIERVELVERDRRGRLRYRDLIRTYGYLGLDARDTKEGCTVNLARPGTPAKQATATAAVGGSGFLADDVIVRAADIRIDCRADLDAFLADTKPGDQATFEVQRGGVTIQLTTTLDYWPLQLIQPETPARTEWGADGRSAANALLQSVELQLDSPMIPSYELGLHSIGSSVLARGEQELPGVASLRHDAWELARSGELEVVFTKRVSVPDADGGGELEFIKRYSLVAAVPDAPPNSEADGQQQAAVPPAYAGYDLQMDIEIRNLGDSPQTVSYVMDGPNGLPLEGWWYTNKIHPAWGAAGARDVVWRVSGSKHSLRSATQIFKQQKEAAESNDPDGAVTSILTDSPSPAERTLDYLGVDTQYFAAVMMAGTINEREPFTCEQAFSMPLGGPVDPRGRGIKTLNTSYRMVSDPASIEPGASVTDQYHLFLGPKSTEVLEAYGLADMIEYGWFGKIARPLSWLLHLFYGIFRNYGLAIVLLTVLVRGAMFPIGRKAARNAQMMQELAPEIKKIKEKYKNDLEKQGQAQRELWRKHNFNPLSGCWLMFLQLPVFIGLYRCLSVDINLRQAPLIPGIEWCSNLAGPDMAWRWQGILPDFLASETGWLGPYLNILPIITIVLFIAQQKMFTPPATDEQTRMQQSMMKYMMIFMGVLFFKVPAGLCVYFIASSLWGIGERKLIPKPGSDPGRAVPAVTPGPKKPSPSTPSAPEKKSWLDRIREKAAAESADARHGRKRRK